MPGGGNARHMSQAHCITTVTNGVGVSYVVPRSLLHIPCLFKFFIIHILLEAV